MSERIRQTKRTTSGQEAVKETVEVDEVDADKSQADKLKAELDGLLDEIDGVLEQNAEEFVKSYIQKGGQ